MDKPVMNINQVLENAKQLNVNERALVAHCLISSLETKQDESVDQAWAELVELIKLLTYVRKSISHIVATTFLHILYTRM